MKIIVAGGGTAGWLTALMTKKFYSDIDITVVESEDIGILGAGEGTTPHFVDVLDMIDIPISDLIRECKATLKLGIRFINWYDFGYEFMHPFSSVKGLDPRPQNNSWYKNLFYIYQTSLGFNPDDLEFQKLLCDQQKSPFVYENFVSPNNPINALRSYSTMALHFDARLLAQFLRRVAETRGIKRVEGVIATEKLDARGHVTSILMEGGSEVPCDFIFDCTGFARKILKDTDEWMSYSEYLPMDSAIPFFFQHHNDVSPETKAIAMRNGWIWQIPVQGRYGCGYVYDSSYANEDEILGEINILFGDVDIGAKRFKFDPGTFRNTYIRNCMRMGLSQSFVEPLEATSIWVACLNLLLFLKSNGIYNTSNIFRRWFNEDCLRRNREVRDFIHMHYMGKRSDSLFWKEFRLKNKTPDSVLERIELMKESPTTSMLEREIFTDMSWFILSYNLGLTSAEKYDKIMKNEIKVNGIESALEMLITNQNRVAQSCMSHKEFIEYMRGEL